MNRYTVIGEYLAAAVDECTCGPGDLGRHEPGCGWEPLMKVSELPRHAVLQALGAKRVYAVQDWIDADGTHDGWRTEQGYYTTAREGAERSLDHDKRCHPDVRFRLASAWMSDWETDE